MEYDRFMKGCGFWMRRRPQSKTVCIFNWGHLIAEMIYDRRIEIWHKQEPREIKGAESLYTNSTPKLRKMMRLKV